MLPLKISGLWKLVAIVLCSGALFYILVESLDFFETHPREAICEGLNDGIWSPVRNSCITEGCYEKGTCGLRSYPASNCHKIRVGDDISRVYLLLGEPAQSQGGKFTWHWDKSSHGDGVIAIFDGRKLVEFVCPASISTDE